MAAIRFNCPRCQMLLHLPKTISQARVRCPRCSHVFRVRVSPKVSLEDTVAGWLSEPEEEEAAPAAAQAGAAENAASAAGPSPAQPKAAAKTPAAAGDELRLLAVERRGALFEFPADCLRTVQFRTAIPRVCLHCLARTHLSARLVIYNPRLSDSMSPEARQASRQPRIDQEKLAGLDGAELLKLLPEVPNVPPPGNLPMPYWVCELCQDSGWISGQIRLSAAARKATCRLFIRNLKLALGFMVKAGRKDSPDYESLKQFLDHLEEDPWDALPSVVRHRLQVWFRSGPGERFLAYVPDRAFVRTEDGMNGLAISTQRLVYHHPPTHQESPRQSELTMQVGLAGTKPTVSLEGPEFKKRTLTVDRSGLMLLRRALATGGFKAMWR